MLQDYIERIYKEKYSFYRENYDQSQRWNGRTSLENKTILIYFEQGLGDTIQFLRYLPFLKNCKVIVACQKYLHTLIQSCFNVEVFDKKLKPPKHDYHALSMSLPFLLGEVKETFPYIKIDQKEELKDNFRIGIAWEGNPHHPNNAERSIPLSYFKEISEIPNVKLFSIQKGMNIPGLFDPEVEIYSMELEDFVDTASLINSMHCVISVDSSPLHLAGAMNKRAFGLLGEKYDHRWKTRVWYPSIRILQGNWKNVFKEVEKEISFISRFV